MSDASEKAADRMHADLDAMASDADRHLRATRDPNWVVAKSYIEQARKAVSQCMSERDRKLAQRG